MPPLTKAQLLASQSKTVQLKAGDVVIRKLKLAELNTHSDDPEKQTFSLIALSLVEPKMTPEEVAELPAETALELQTSILEYNGLTDEAADQLEKN